MDYVHKLDKWSERRSRIVFEVAQGKPRSVVARKYRVSRQRVYQLTSHIQIRRT